MIVYRIIEDWGYDGGINPLNNDFILYKSLDEAKKIMEQYKINNNNWQRFKSISIEEYEIK